MKTEFNNFSIVYLKSDVNQLQATFLRFKNMFGGFSKLSTELGLGNYSVQLPFLPPNFGPKKCYCTVDDVSS